LSVLYFGGNMGKRNNRECIICKTPYHYCPTCGEDSGKPSWYHIFDSQNCHDIYEVCTQYRDKIIDAETAYNLISKLDLSKIDAFAESTRLQIEEIKKIHEEATVNVAVVVEEKNIESVKEITKNANNTKNYKKK